MAHVLVSGLVNIETTLRVESFPLPYFPVTYPFHGVHTSVSGVGINVAKALYSLGNSISILTQVGNDNLARVVQEDLAQYGLDTTGVLPLLAETPQSVILYESGGRRQIHVDLKEIQDSIYPESQFAQALSLCDVAVLCNINFSRPWLSKARDSGTLVATDVHVLSTLDDPYNRDFIENADILFLSDEHVQDYAWDFLRGLASRSPAFYIVMGRGAQGALLYDRKSGEITAFPAVVTRSVLSTIGAGDALFSAFVHGIAHRLDGKSALARAMVFASWKIGAKSASDGFLSSQALEQACKTRECRS